MSRSLVIDSSVFLSAWNSAESFHSESSRFFDHLSRKEYALSAPELAAFEISNVLIRLGLSAKLPDYLQIFEEGTVDLIPLSEEVLEHFVKLAGKISLKTADLIFCAVAKQEEASLITWDKQLVKTASKAIPAMTPTEWLEKTP